MIYLTDVLYRHYTLFFTTKRFFLALPLIYVEKKCIGIPIYTHIFLTEVCLDYYVIFFLFIYFVI